MIPGKGGTVEMLHKKKLQEGHGGAYRIGSPLLQGIEKVVLNTERVSSGRIYLIPSRREDATSGCE